MTRSTRRVLCLPSVFIKHIFSRVSRISRLIVVSVISQRRVEIYVHAGVSGRGRAGSLHREGIVMNGSFVLENGERGKVVNHPAVQIAVHVICDIEA